MISDHEAADLHNQIAEAKETARAEALEEAAQIAEFCPSVYMTRWHGAGELVAARIRKAVAYAPFALTPQTPDTHTRERVRAGVGLALCNIPGLAEDEHFGQMVDMVANAACAALPGAPPPRHEAPSEEHAS